MQLEITNRPASSVARVRLQQGESLTCEVGAMIAMSPHLVVETSSAKKGGGGGLVAGLKRLVAGENFFLNHFTAQAADQELILGPGLLGDIVQHRLESGHLVVQGSSWLASDPGIQVDATFQGIGKALFSGESIFWVKCSGRGDVLLSSFGAIYEVEVDGEYIVDTGHIVAYEDTLQFQMDRASKSLIGSFLGGEGLVCRFKGRGKLYCQSHNPPSFGQALGPLLTARAD
ncbi:TIGR00266 family protein [Corallococcus sp. CA053C]|uniref:TIGR00266 family protein n=1 Tax=Corallococcus sp. CA053C TaxID=2316732 RepID=UPI000EA32AF5|nr:TIGR00266 family protein [Corallococcus sp. CA053C]RKH13973.1 TIGR00266 family protein [Corallococcus sp. CA053C]